MSTKEKGFIVSILFSIIAFSWSVKFSDNMWLIIGILFLHISLIISLASFSRQLWIAVIFPIFWLMADFSSDINAFLYTFAVGVPLSFLYIAVSNNFKLRIKVRFSPSVRPALTQALLITSLVLSFYAPSAFSREDAEQYLMKIVPNNFSMDNIVDKATNSVFDQCKGNIECETMLKETLDSKKSSSINNDIKKQAVSASLSGISDKQFPMIIALLAFGIIAPFSFIFSIVIAFFASLIFSLLRIFGIIRTTRKTVEQEILT